jgi:hypothetical protein
MNINTVVNKQRTAAAACAVSRTLDTPRSGQSNLEAQQRAHLQPANITSVVDRLSKFALPHQYTKEQDIGKVLSSGVAALARNWCERVKPYRQTKDVNDRTICGTKVPPDDMLETRAGLPSIEVPHLCRQSSCVSAQTGDLERNRTQSGRAMSLA